MRITDKQLMKWTKGVWTELAVADCNPDIIPLSLCDACEIGFNKGFSAAFGVALAFSISAFIGGTAYSIWKNKK